MLTLHLAHTSPINPPSATPILTLPQIWAGLQRKIRFAQEFVPIISSCSVVSDADGVVVRDVVFKPGVGPKEKAREVVRSFGESWVDFQQEDGSVIKNIISTGGEGELYMTYVFEFRFEGIEEGSKEAGEKREMLKGTCKMAVEKSIETIRRMVVEGKI